jgi:hypothetical protein
MSDAELIAKVAEMRTAQKSYFSSRDQDMLRKSAELERQVDRELWERQSGQRHLFNEEIAGG